MRVLVVKLTSMGDVLHVMPALTDLMVQYPDAIVDWMVEDSFAEIPTWHSSVDRVVLVATRRWRNLKWTNVVEFFQFIKSLRRQRYDVVVDAQGLIKSAIFARFAKLADAGVRVGFSGDSIKESPAAKLYQKTVQVGRDQHAIDRLRQLFAGGFGYKLSVSGAASQPNLALPNYGLSCKKTTLVSNTSHPNPTIFLLHGTTWPTKHLPDVIWRELAELIVEDGYTVVLCWGNEAEKYRAEWIASGLPQVQVLPKSNLTELKASLSTASGAIAVDTGLGHLAAALGLPCVSVYGATNAALTGAVGEHQQWQQSTYPCSPCLLKTCPKLTEQIQTPPCYQELVAAQIWEVLYDKIA